MTYNEFINQIQQYDSDTFPLRKMSRKRAGMIAQRCLEFFINNTLDGIILSDFYEETSASHLKELGE